MIFKIIVVKNRINILHAPTTVGGNPQGLSKSLNRLGLSSKSLTLYQNYLNYDCDFVIWSDTDNKFIQELKRLATILWVAFNYDIIHYNFGTTIAMHTSSKEVYSSKIKQLLGFLYRQYRYNLQLLELNLFRLLGKILFVTYQGDDARQGGFSLERFKFNIASQVPVGYYSARSDQMKRKMIRRLSQYCDQVYALNPDLMHVLPQETKFVPYSHIFLEEWVPIFNQLENRTLRIAHAPTNRKVKGTEIILEALNRLEDKGYKFEVILVEGMSHAQAKKAYATADIVIDQLFAGWYGGLAVEVMALGKPVMVYIRDQDLEYIPEEMANDLPFIRVNPDNFEDKLQLLLELPREELCSIARKSRAYVEKWHDPLKIAEDIRKDYETALQKRNRYFI